MIGTIDKLDHYLTSEYWKPRLFIGRISSTSSEGLAKSAFENFFAFFFLSTFLVVTDLSSPDFLVDPI